jgi:hypothetical protein
MNPEKTKLLVEGNKLSKRIRFEFKIKDMD